MMVFATTLITGMATNSYADGFSTAHTEQFKLNSNSMMATEESLRAAYNAASRSASGSASGTTASQGSSNMANVIQTTENYSIILNGDNNTVGSQAGTVGATQTGSGVNQAADNQAATKLN